MDTLLAKGLMSSLIFHTHDVDALFEHVRASGAEVLQEPADQLYGSRGLRVPRPGRQHAPLQEGALAGVTAQILFSG